MIYPNPYSSKTEGVFRLRFADWGQFVFILWLGKNKFFIILSKSEIGSAIVIHTLYETVKGVKEKVRTHEAQIASPFSFLFISCPREPNTN